MHPSQEIKCSKSDIIKDKIIVLCITGSIAAVEVVRLIRELVRHGAEVYPVMSKDACHILHPDSIEFASGRKPILEIDGSVPYVGLCGEDHEADLLLIAPATANTISKIAWGIADTPPTIFALAALGSDMPILIVPAMHIALYRQAIVTQNIEKLRKLGARFIEPRLEEKKAKIAGIEEVVANVMRILGPRDMEGKKTVVIAGSTSEEIDDVRFITSRSSGRTGIELAKRAFERGSDVELWLGRSEETPPQYIPTKMFVSTSDLMRLVESIECDICAIPAAISDYRPKRAEGKIPAGKKSLTLELSPTPKVIEKIRRKARDCMLIGFKAESGVSKEELIKKASSRLKSASLDYIVANDIKDVRKDITRVILISKRGEKKEIEGLKFSVAQEIWNGVLYGL